MYTVLTHDAAPDCVVEVEHEDLLRQTKEGAQLHKVVVNQRGYRLGCRMLLGQVPKAGIVPRRPPHFSRHRVEVEHAHSLPGGLMQGEVCAQEDTRASTRMSASEVAAAVMGGKVETVLNDMALQLIAAHLP